MTDEELSAVATMAGYVLHVERTTMYSLYVDDVVGSKHKWGCQGSLDTEDMLRNEVVRQIARLNRSKK